MAASWPTPEITSGLGISTWASQVRPLLVGLGADTTLALLLFNRSQSFSVFPIPQFSAYDQAHTYGLLPFSAEPGEDSYHFEPKHHLLRLQVGSTPILMLGVLGKSYDAVRAYVDGWCERAGPKCAQILESLYVVYMFPFNGPR